MLNKNQQKDYYESFVKNSLAEIISASFIVNFTFVNIQ